MHVDSTQGKKPPSGSNECVTHAVAEGLTAAGATNGTEDACEGVVSGAAPRTDGVPESASGGATPMTSSSVPGPLSDEDPSDCDAFEADVHVDSSQRVLRSHGNKRPVPSLESSPSQLSKSQIKREKKKRQKEAKKTLDKSVSE